MRRAGRFLILLLFVSVSTVVSVDARDAETVRVVDESGGAVENARLEVLLPARESAGPLTGLARSLLVTRTGVDGGPELTLPRIDGAILIVDHPDYAPTVTRLPLASGRLALERLPVLSLRVRSERDRPVSEVGACAEWKEELAAFDRTLTWRRCRESPGSGPDVVIPGVATESARIDVIAADHLPFRGIVAVSREPLEVLLRPGILLPGRVLDPQGRPVRGASVSVLEKGMIKEPISPSTTDEDGAFEIAIPGLPVTLFVEADGLKDGAHEIVPNEEGDLSNTTLRLEWAEEVVAEVLVTHRKEPPPVVLTIERYEPNGKRSRQSVEFDLESTPSVRAELPGPGRYRFVFDAPGAQTHVTEVFEIVRGEVLKLGAVDLGRGGVLRGRLEDGRDGGPVAGAAIQLISRGSGLLHQLLRGRLPATVSDEEGEFEMTGLGEGLFEVRIETPEHGVASREARFDGPEVVDLGTVTLHEPVDVDGRVADAAGAGVPEAMVGFFGIAGELDPVEAVSTDAEGRFALTLSAGEYRVEVRRGRLLLEQPVSVGLDGRELDLRVDLVRVEGSIRRGGVPVDGGLVTLIAEQDSSLQRGKLLVNSRGGGTQSWGVAESRWSADVDDRGTFQLEDVSPGPAFLTFLDLQGAEDGRQIEIASSPRVTLDIDLEGRDLEGRVVDSQTGAGLSATVEALSGPGLLVTSVRTFSDGSFQLEDLAGGTLVLRVESSGYETATRRLSPSSWPDRLEIRLDPSSSRQLVLELVRENGTGAPFAQVTLVDDIGSVIRSGLTDSGGSWLVGEVPSGTYRAIWRDSWSGIGATILNVDSTSVERISLPPGTSLEIDCSPCAGRPVRAMLLMDATGTDLAPQLLRVGGIQRFGTEGRLPIGMVSEGSYRLVLLVEGAGELSHDVIARSPFTRIELR